MADDLADPEPIRFRTSKKRKAYRQRAPEDDDDDHHHHDSNSNSNNDNDNDNNSSSTPAPIPIAPPRAPTSPHTSIPRSFGDDDNADADADDQQPADHAHDPADDLSIDHAEQESAAAAALRLRTSRRAARLRGMGFKSDTQPRSETPSQALVHKDPDATHDAAVASGVDSRFMHQTGLLTILDDVHITSKHHPNRASSPSPSDDDNRDSNSDQDPDQDKDRKPAPAPAGIHSRAKDHQPARHGKLFEVAIPDDVRKDSKGKDKDRDREKDAAKRRRMHDPRDKDARRPGRTSDDMERDAMVEQFLHENRLDVYDVAEPSASSSRYAPGKDFSADARLAEQFRRQYYEDLALRRKKRRPALSKKEQQQQRAAQATEVLKGPKLGGSRNQRAAIRNILLQQQGEKKA
ncbi:hypothetical protein ESCO_000983 [Escovopsis weberi]|uniref:Uncharacterized protein n=1 Tax=Escovopsis weberi TaxID=150374 RepID=A0A0M8N4L6_ESCWE|nr:hypothetical protein ESCO_000983 [Escovopsis weberi]